MSFPRDELLYKLMEQMRHVTRTLMARHELPLGETPLTHPQVSLLLFISKHPDGVTAKEIANALHITPGAVTQFVDELIAKKLLTRKRHPQDRRAIKITLAAGEKKKFSDLQKKYLTLMQPLFIKMNDQEIEQLIFLLKKISPS